LGSLRSTAQLISYELILSSAILLIVLLSGSLDLNVIVEYQKSILFLYPLLPVFIIFLIGGIAETNRAPFDLAEAESELVSGFMTEHAAVIFVFFFLAEYASIVLICVLISILFFGGYTYSIMNLVTLIDYSLGQNISNIFYNTDSIIQFSIEGLLSGMLLGLKGCAMVFVFI
jgi:NADH-ubiquinone oxidoreductase chain 1